MNTNENKSPSDITNTIFDPQLKLLMSIRHFDQDLDNYISNVESTTQKLTSNYESGTSMLEQYADSEHKKQWEELMNEIRVHSNQLNQVLKIAQDRVDEREGFEFEGHWKEFDNRLKELKESAQSFENLGAKILEGTQKDRWESDIRIFETQIEPEIKRNAQAAKLIFQFMYRYEPEGLERINNIVNQNIPENTEEIDPKDLEASYVKAFKEFQKEFKPQNLWDTFLEILAGGVHPSPSERVMLEKWSDGEQKTREDM